MNAPLWNRRAFLRAAGIVSLVGPSILLEGCKHENRSATTEQAQRSLVQTVRMVSDDKGHIFYPDRLRVQPGDTVKWVLQSGVHTSTAYHPDFFDKPLRIPEKAKPWHSGVLKEIGQSFELKFEVGGVYNYYCTPHQSLGMVGIIVVGEPLDGPGLMLPEDIMESEGMMTEGMLYERERQKLIELVEWAKKLNS